MSAISGFVIGLLFGFGLQRGGIVRYPRLMGMLLLKDLKAMKFMFTAVLVALLGTQLIISSAVTLRPNPLDMGSIVGAVLFGMGMGITALCGSLIPVRIGEGKWLTVFALLGIVAGNVATDTVLYEWAVGLVREPLLAAKTIPELLGVSAAAVTIGLAIFLVAVILLADRLDPEKKRIAGLK